MGIIYCLNILDCMKYVQNKTDIIGLGCIYGSSILMLSNSSKGRRLNFSNCQLLILEAMTKSYNRSKNLLTVTKKIASSSKIYSRLLCSGTFYSYNELNISKKRFLFLSNFEAINYGL